MGAWGSLPRGIRRVMDRTPEEHEDLAQPMAQPPGIRQGSADTGEAPGESEGGGTVEDPPGTPAAPGGPPENTPGGSPEETTSADSTWPEESPKQRPDPSGEPV